jgi:hypothetical protein
MPPPGGLCLYCFGFNRLRKLEPFPFPTGFVAGFDPGAGAGDIEYIAAALLRLRHEAQGLASEGMSRREEIKHLCLPRLSLKV